MSIVDVWNGDAEHCSLSEMLDERSRGTCSASLCSRYGMCSIREWDSRIVVDLLGLEDFRRLLGCTNTLAPRPRAALQYMLEK